nr:hypothetical protein [uncultured Anaeromusa sp.]
MVIRVLLINTVIFLGIALYKLYRSHRKADINKACALYYAYGVYGKEPDEAAVLILQDFTFTPKEWQQVASTGHEIGKRVEAGLWAMETERKMYPPTT